MKLKKIPSFYKCKNCGARGQTKRNLFKHLEFCDIKIKKTSKKIKELVEIKKDLKEKKIKTEYLSAYKWKY